MQESLEYMQTTINDLFSSLNKIRYMMWLKEEVEKENLKFCQVKLGQELAKDKTCCIIKA